MAKKGLGKGIDVLIPQAKEKTKSEKENIKISKDALFTIARSSAGGMRDSLALLDQLSVMLSLIHI